MADLKEGPERTQANLILGEKEEMTEGKKPAGRVKQNHSRLTQPSTSPLPLAQVLDPPATDLGKGITLN